MAKQLGRPSAKYRTGQVRMDLDTISVLKRLSGAVGLPLTEAMREWLLPLARAELARRLRAEVKDLARPMQNGGEKNGTAN